MTKKCNIFMAFLKSFAILIASSMITLAIQGIFKSEDLGTLFGYVVCIAGLYGIYRNKIKEDIKNFKDDFKKYFPKTLLVSTILIILEIIISLILKKNGLISVNQNVAEVMIKESPILMFISSAILAPIAEELTFRMPYYYAKGNKIFIYIFYSIVFASVHLFGIADLITLLYFIPYLLLSLGIGYGFYKSNNIFMSTIIHILNNIIAIMLILI